MRSTDPRPGSRPSLLNVIKSDLAATARLKGIEFPSLGAYADLLTLPGVWAVLLFRVAHFFHTHSLRPLSRICYFANVVLFGADLAPGAKVGPGLSIAHPVFCGWGSELEMGSNIIMTGGVRFGTAARPDRKGHPRVGNEVFFLDAAKVLGGVTIGDGALIAANALVVDDVPANAIMVGQPARFTRYRDEVGLDNGTLDVE
jgi:serine O-acetyltransferase